MYDRALGTLQNIKGEFLRGYHFYSKENHRHQREDQMIVLDVKDGLRNGEFIFYVQPQVMVKSGKIIGGEALARWNHKGQLVPPARFVPVLEKPAIFSRSIAACGKAWPGGSGASGSGDRTGAGFRECVPGGLLFCGYCRAFYQSG